MSPAFLIQGHALGPGTCRVQPFESSLDCRASGATGPRRKMIQKPGRQRPGLAGMFAPAGWSRPRAGGKGGGKASEANSLLQEMKMKQRLREEENKRVQESQRSGGTN
ncbi:unnamed protein product [Prorocentrum cordatum]|uniref:Uncharacterized protein n=1 Tax=Prorocentrum cordatum TaxID=2364126 RepID=A0ABN9W177_9DINO|nr:unnamed protein product [Polarella glacialis]